MPTSYSSRTIPTTTFSGRSTVTTSYTTRIPDSIFLMTQLLDFLMTQDNNYIVLQDSYHDTIYTGRTLI